jgi:hypothetical protein
VRLATAHHCATISYNEFIQKWEGAIVAVTLEQVLEMARQLSEADKQTLVAELLESVKDPRELTQDEFEALIDDMVLPGKPANYSSDRRIDWYSDDGR